MKNDEKILLAKTEDLSRLSSRSHEAKFSAFLDESEQSAVEEIIHRRQDGTPLFWGGYPDAGRRILGIFPDWMEPEKDAFPIRILKITKNFSMELSHRDYLGTILSQGIQRNRVGDILVTEDGAFVFLADGMERALSLSKIAGCGVSSEVVSLSEITIPETKFKEYAAVAASLRLDAVVAAALNCSRKQAAALISAEKISVNHKLAVNGSKTASAGDLLSIRGVGRILIDQTGENTRSGRLHLVFKKYI